MPVPASSAYASLSNDDLRRRLKAVNYDDVGPINDTTRNVYLKTLAKLEAEDGSLSPKTTPSRSQDPSPSRARPSRRSVGVPVPAASKSPSRRKSTNFLPDPPSVSPLDQSRVTSPRASKDITDSKRLSTRWPRCSGDFSDNEDGITGFRRVPREPVRVSAKPSFIAASLPKIHRFISLQWNKILFYIVTAVIVIIFLFARSPGPTDSYPVCTLDDDRPDCIPSSELQGAVQNFKAVKLLLDGRALLHDWPQCGNELDAAVARVNRGLTTNEIIGQLFRPPFQPVYFKKLRHVSSLAKENPHWGVGLIASDGSRTEELASADGLESKTGFFPFTCLLKYAMSAFLPKFIMLGLSTLLLYAGYYGFCYFKHQKVRKDQEVQEMIEKALMVLSARRNESPSDPCLPVHVVRDNLIKAPMRNDRATLAMWNKVVSYMDTQEPRIDVGVKRMNGYDVKVWTFRAGNAPKQAEVPQPAHDEPMDTSDARADSQDSNHRMWQGHAFDTNALKSSPTPCLKIRNMFDPEMESGDDWPLQIHESLLEKCDGIPIVHIAVDRESREGTVYMKCANEEAAGRAYKLLHGHWFDGNLVTVKYLLVDRYHQRFPQAQNMDNAIRR